MSFTAFVTGTDTDAGKTLVAQGILHYFREQGVSTLGLKPVAAGCEETEAGRRNADALCLQAASSISLDYSQVNPVALREPIAPHIAAFNEKKRPTLDRLTGVCRGALMHKPELCLIEGAGGWRVPLNNAEMLSGLAVRMNIPVILVVGIKLGCINHALLTAEAMRRDGVHFMGWVANIVDAKMLAAQENIETLQRLLPAPLMAQIPFLSEPSVARVIEHLSGVEKWILPALNQ